MKISFAALVVALSFASVDYIKPVTAAAAPALSCTVTPGGIPSTTTCTTNYANDNYNAQYTLSGLPAGTYTYAWSSNKPGLETGCATVCNLGFNADGADYRNAVTVTATDLSNGTHYTLTTRVMVLAVCGGGTYFC